VCGVNCKAGRVQAIEGTGPGLEQNPVPARVPAAQDRFPQEAQPARSLTLLAHCYLIYLNHYYFLICYSNLCIKKKKKKELAW
jgi:hypothetical protein